MRVLGIDYGFKRIGVAIGVTVEASPGSKTGDNLGQAGIGVTTPRASLAASGALKTDAVNIAQLAKAEEVEEIVLGLPVEESGIEGRMARVCRTLARHLADLGINVKFVDESYTSLEAEQVLAKAGVPARQRKQHKDGEAAGLILERYFDGQQTP